MNSIPRLPTVWMLTDERLGGARRSDPLWLAIARLPPGSGLIFRHYGLAAPARRALLAEVARYARRRRLLLVVACPPPGVVARNRHWPAGLVGRGGRAPGVQTAAAHDRAEVEKAARAGADLILLSPVFATTSHARASPLGPLRFGLVAHGRSRAAARVPLIALGGMSKARGRRLAGLGASGWAAISAWTNAPAGARRAAA